MNLSHETLAELNLLVSHFAQQAEVIDRDQGAQTNETQAHILMLLDQQPQTNSDIAKQMNLSRPAITKAVKLLNQQGFITNHPSANDRRSTTYKLTASGQQLASAHRQAHHKTISQVQAALASLTADQQEAVMTFLQRLNQNFGKDIS